MLVVVMMLFSLFGELFGVSFLAGAEPVGLPVSRMCALKVTRATMTAWVGEDCAKLLKRQVGRDRDRDAGASLGAGDDLKQQSLPRGSI